MMESRSGQLLQAAASNSAGPFSAGGRRPALYRRASGKLLPGGAGATIGVSHCCCRRRPVVVVAAANGPAQTNESTQGADETSNEEEEAERNGQLLSIGTLPPRSAPADRTRRGRPKCRQGPKVGGLRGVRTGGANAVGQGSRPPTGQHSLTIGHSPESSTGRRRCPRRLETLCPGSSSGPTL